MKSKAMVNQYPDVKLTEAQWATIRRDYASGLTKEVIMSKYKINSWQYKEIRNYLLNPVSREEGQLASNKLHHRLQNAMRKSGAIKQGRNETCLCGSGLKYKNCCGK